MDVVVDTNVVASALLDPGAIGVSARHALQRAGLLSSPEFIRAELTNVLWMWCRAGDGSLEDALTSFNDAEAILDDVVSSTLLWPEALALALARDHPAYDALFVALARRRGTVVITFDKRMRRAFPEDVLLVDEFLDGD